MKNNTKTGASYREAGRLYRSAFPKEERIPFWMLRLWAMIPGIVLHSYRENGRFIGFANFSLGIGANAFARK